MLEGTNRSTRDDRIVVTGLGVVAATGAGLERFWQSLLRGNSQIRANSYFPQSRVRGRAVGRAEFAPETTFSWSSPPRGDGCDRLFQIATSAINEALDHAGLTDSAGCRHLAATGLFISSAVGPVATMEAQIGADLRNEVRSADSWRAFSFGRLAATLADKCGLGGPYVVVPTGCTGGSDAVSYGLSAIRSGMVDLAVVGGFDAPITPLVEAAFARIGATSSRDCPVSEASCPFDARRDGFVLGEGGGALVLERESYALARGATPLGIIAGYGAVSSAFHMTDIHPSGVPIARSIALALDDAGISAGRIDHVNLHGSSTPMNDVAEARALLTVLGEAARRTPVTSIKSQIGHALAAASAIELVAVIMTLRDQVIPPTVNQLDQDPEIDLDVVSDRPRPAHIRNVLKTASGFGGIHSAIVASRYRA